MRKRWIVTLGALALMLAIGGWAEAVPVNTCTAGVHRVSAEGSAVAIGANGYNNPACHLIIDVSITPIPLTTLALSAHDITIDPAGGPTPGVVVEIVNNNPQSVIQLNADETDITISEAHIKAHKLLRIVCTTGVGLPDCNLIVRLSELVATFDFAAPAPGFGDVKIIVDGNVDIQTSTVHGGARVEVTAKYGFITLLCAGGGDSDCKDPVPSKAVELCGTCPAETTCPPTPRVAPAVFPCDVTFPTAGDLTAVCFPTPPGVRCNGGSVEKRFSACGDITITGSTITSVEHMTFETKGLKRNGDQCDGHWLAAGATLTAESIVANIKGDGTSPSIDLSNATLNTSAHITITAGSECPSPLAAYPANVCINANGASIQASNIIMTADTNTGVIDLCGTAAADTTQVPTRPPQAVGATLINDVGADFPTFNGDSTPPYISATVLNGIAECGALVPAKFGAYIDCTGPGGSCPPGVIDP